MITESTIYWILKLDELRGVCVFVCVLIGLAGVGSFIGWVVNTTEREFESANWFRSIFFKMSFLFGFCVIVGTLIPSTKQMAMIKVVPMIANSEIVGEMSTDAKEIYKMGIDAIKKQIQITGRE